MVQRSLDEKRVVWSSPDFVLDDFTALALPAQRPAWSPDGAFLAVPRYAALARGAALVVLSDGLERGDPTAMADAVARFSRIAWRIVWLTPLAADPGFEPRTAGLVAARPYIDELGDGGSIEKICAHVLDLAEVRAA